MTPHHHHGFHPSSVTPHRIDEQNEVGKTALWRACHGGNWVVAQALVEGGADPTLADNTGQSPQDIAKEKGKKYVTILEVREGIP